MENSLQSSSRQLQEPIPQWQRPASIPQPINQPTKTKKSFFKRPVPWQMTVGAFLILLCTVLSILN